MTKLSPRQELASSDAITFIAVLVIALAIHFIFKTRLNAGGLFGVATAGFSLLIIYKVSRAEMFTPRYILIGMLGNIMAQLLLKYLGWIG